jgi:glycogen debranching enzyme
LSSAVTRDNAMLTTDMTNPDLYDGGRLALARDMVHLLRCKVLCDGACFEQVAIRNYADHAVSFTLSIAFAADFADIFEVRGQRRQRRGELLAPEIDGTTAILGYLGRDGVKRRTHFCFAETPSSLSEHEARYVLSLPPGGSTTLHLTFRCEVDGAIAAPDATFMSCRANAAALARQRRATGARIHSSNAAFNAWIERSRADLDMLITQKETGPYPYAGIPWFSTAFGRDAIVTALECLWIRPELARGCLGFLAATQATDISPEADAQPGKILHETRGGEMAALGEVPFKRYYGSVDSTPLFVVLAAAYYERTGDIDFIRSIWPNINAALQWMSQYGDPDGDGFLEYGTTAERGLTNQGWKDSSDSIFHADGRLAKAPIALVEVQAYAYAAWRGAAVMAEALGEKPRHDALMRQATELAHRFETTYWCDEINSYALALDADKKPCRVRSSNAGHALFAGIASPERAKRVAATLMDPTSFSEWGIRTVATSEARYNPMSYHNGSVWPHDNGLIALGFAHYGLRQPLLKIMGGLYDAAAAVELHRLPELFCGFPRRKGEGPTAYPVACNPQAWASASAFALLGAVLGVSFHPGARQIRFTRPVLPPFLEEIRLERLGMGEVSVDLLFHRHVRDAALVVLHKEGRADIVLVSG